MHIFNHILYYSVAILLLFFYGCSQKELAVGEDTCVLELVVTSEGTSLLNKAEGVKWDYRYYIFNSHNGELMRTRDIRGVEHYKESIILTQVNYSANIYVLVNHANIPMNEFQALSEDELLNMIVHIDDNIDPITGSGGNPSARPILLGSKLNVLLTPQSEKKVEVKIPLQSVYARLELDISFTNGEPTPEELESFFVTVNLPQFSWLTPGKGICDFNKNGNKTAFAYIDGNRIKGELLILENEQGVKKTNKNLDDMLRYAPKNATKLLMGIGEISKYALYIGGEPGREGAFDFTSYNVRRGYRYRYYITIDVGGLRAAPTRSFSTENPGFTVVTTNEKL